MNCKVAELDRLRASLSTNFACLFFHSRTNPSNSYLTVATAALGLLIVASTLTGARRPCRGCEHSRLENKIYHLFSCRTRNVEFLTWFLSGRFRIRSCGSVDMVVAWMKLAVWNKKRTFTPFRHGWCVLIICSQVPLVNGVFMQRLTPLHRSPARQLTQKFAHFMRKGFRNVLVAFMRRFMFETAIKFYTLSDLRCMQSFFSLLIHFNVLLCCFFYEMAQIRAEKWVGKHCQYFVGAVAERKDVKLGFSFGFRSQTSVGVGAAAESRISLACWSMREIKWNQTTLNCAIKQKFLRNFDIAPRRRRAYGAEITWNTIEHVPKLREHNNDSIVSCFKRQEKCDKLFCLGNFPAEHWTLSAFSNLTPPPAFCGWDTCENLIHNRLRDSIRAHVAYGSFQKGSEKFACLTM